MFVRQKQVKTVYQVISRHEAPETALPQPPHAIAWSMYCIVCVVQAVLKFEVVLATCMYSQQWSQVELR